MKIRLATNNDALAWDQYVFKHPNAVAYHQFAWGQAVKRAYGFDPIYLVSTDDGCVVGIYPLIEMKIPPCGSQLVSLPYCDMGGVLADSDIVKMDLQNYALNFARACKIKRLELRQSADCDVMSQSHKVRMLLYLPNSSVELMAKFKAKLRSQIKKPIKDGLTFEFGNMELLNEFYQVMSVNMRDLGSPVHSFVWFKEILKFYKENARIGIVRSQNGKAIAAGLILLHKNTVSIPWASALRKYNRSNPNMLLYWNFLAFSADNGYSVFDFGRSTPEEGTYKFKEQWGAKPHPLQWIGYSLGDLTYRSDSSSQGHSSMLRQCIAAMWQRLPLPLANALGPLLRKRISL